MQKIRAVILDLDGTLYDYDALDRVAFARVGELVRERLGVSEEQYGEAFMRARKSTKKKLGETAPSHSRMLYFQKTLEYLDIRPLYLALEMYETYWGFSWIIWFFIPEPESFWTLCMISIFVWRSVRICWRIFSTESFGRLA